MYLFDANGNKIEVSGSTTEEESVVQFEPSEHDIPVINLKGTLPTTKTDTPSEMWYRSETGSFHCYIKIKAQGSSSMQYPKKNYTIKLYRDPEYEYSLKKDFKGWGKQNKFVLKANWVDLSHARNVCTAKLWADMVASRPDFDSLPTELQTAPNMGAIDGFPVKVYNDGVYLGRYTLNIPKDGWTYNMDEDKDEHCIIVGESNYSDECLFKATSAVIDGTNWKDELHDTVPTVIQNRWNEILRFVVESSDEEFKANITSYIDLSSIIDYYILMLVSADIDGLGKNSMFLTYDAMKFYANAYDMDATWGNYTSGGITISATVEMPSGYVASTGNNLLDRVESNFLAEIKERYAVLRGNVLSFGNILSIFDRFCSVCSTELIAEDYAETTGTGLFTGIPAQDSNNIRQIREFVKDRLSYTDSLLAE